MSQTKHKLLRGEALFAVLALTRFPVKLVRDGHSHDCLSPAQAMLVARAGLFEGKCNSTRVYHIREIDDRKSHQDVNPHYWDDRAAIRWHSDQTSTPASERNRQSCAAWMSFAMQGA